MTKVQSLVSKIVAKDLAAKSYQAEWNDLAAGYGDDECTCCVDSQIESQICSYEHELQGEINAAFLLSTQDRSSKSLLELADEYDLYSRAA